MKNNIVKIIAQRIKNLNKTTLKQLILSVIAILTMTGRVTMLSISRWSSMSYRTVGRFLDKKIDWLKINYSFIKDDVEEDFIIAGDECTVSKSGYATHNIGYFYSGLQNRAIKSIQFLVFSAINPQERRSYPLFAEQLKQEKIQEKKSSQLNKQEKRKKGRPKGSSNSVKENVELTGIFKVIHDHLKKLKKEMELPKNRYFVYDGMMGCNIGVVATNKAEFHLISKLKSNSALYFKFEGEQKSRGRKRKYGNKIDFTSMDPQYLQESNIKSNIETKIYQFEALSKSIYCPLNVVLIYTRDLQTNKENIKLLFSTDVKLEYKKIINYYSSRFQIEFNFRDSKQFFGLEDFMNIKKERIHNFANLSLFMNNVTYIVSKKQGFSEYSINDMKTLLLTEKYVSETLKLYGKKADRILIQDISSKISEFMMIHRDSA